VTVLTVTPYLDYFFITAIVTWLLASYFLFSFFGRLKKLRLIAAIRKLLSLIFFSSIAGFTSLILISTRGYQALTDEQKIAFIHITPNSQQGFVAEMTFANGERETYVVQGDEIMIEANILKWKSWTNVLGLTTAYRLDRIRGRYSNLQDERNRPPSVYSIQTTSDIDLADWRSGYQQLSFLLDVEQGAASYVSAKQEKQLELMVTTSGLLLREVKRIE